MKLISIKAVGFLFGIGLLAMSGCGADAGIEISGSWQSDYDALEEISDTSWSTTASSVTTVYSIVKFDNETNMLITQNAADAAYDPEKFNKLVWTEISNDTFYYCMVDYSKASVAEAEASTETADSSDPTTSDAPQWPQLRQRVSSA